MNVFTNEGYFKEQIARARRLRWAGILSLAVVFVISILSIFASLPPVVILLTYPFLLAGFPLMTIGRTRLKLLSRTPRDDQLLNNELKGLNNKYALHHYVPIGDKVIKHLLVSPVGLVAIETRDTMGQVICKGGPKGDRWRVRTNFLDRFSGLNLPL